MANVANTKNTGPASKNMISGGKKFPLNGSVQRGNGMSLTNSSTGVQKTIMGMKFSAGSIGGTPNEKTFTGHKMSSKGK